MSKLRRRIIGGSSGGSSENQYLINVDDYLTIEALEDGLTVSLNKRNVEYCVNGDGNWKTLSAGTETESINARQILSFRLNVTLKDRNSFGNFVINKNFNLKGNVMSLLYGDNGKNNYSLSSMQYAFNALFKNCTTLKTVSKKFLPATTLEDFCYTSMFSGCTSLTTAPDLPAKNLKSWCYGHMFQGCTSLITAPDLPARKASWACYCEMFRGCTSLTTAPELPATTVEQWCYRDMFRNCTSLVNVPSILPATTLGEQCYTAMFYGCNSLKTAPELPAKTLTIYCYDDMFYNCSSLNYIKMLATDISAEYCLSGWVLGVSSTGTFVKNPEATWDVVGVNGVPEGWTVKFDGEENGI